MQITLSTAPASESWGKNAKIEPCFSAKSRT